MTAFARNSYLDQQNEIVCEIRIVNHKYFDCIIKLPEIVKYIDSIIREKLQKQLQRGRIDCSFQIIRSEIEQNDIMINIPLVEKLTTSLKELSNYFPVKSIDPIKLLLWPGIINNCNKNIKLDEKQIFLLFDKTLNDIVSIRTREGSSIYYIIEDKLRKISELIMQIENQLPSIEIEYRNRIIKKFNEYDLSFDMQRFEQEVLYFLQKTDVMEEIDRIRIHICEINRILNEEIVVGKKLDFLIQELNREINTLTSKSTNIKVIQIAIELKVLIEQIREQIQNLV